MKKLQLVAMTFCLSILLSSCARNYHLELVGHYKPNSDVAKKSMSPSTARSEEIIQPITHQNESEGVASVSESKPDLKPVQLPGQQSFSTDLTEKQQQKLNQKLEKLKAKVEKLAAQREIKSQEKNLSTNQNSAKSSSDDSQILLVILAILLPPLSVYLLEDAITTHFWIDLLLTLLFWIPGVIYALILIL